MARETGLRTRLSLEIEKAIGPVSTTTLRSLADKAGVPYTTLARFLLYAEPRRTERLRRQTVMKLARTLDLNPDWLIDGQGDKQLSFWPIIFSDDPVGPSTDELIQTKYVFQFVTGLGAGEERIRICRAVTASCIESAVRAGVFVPRELYSALVQIDSLLVHEASKKSA